MAIQTPMRGHWHARLQPESGQDVWVIQEQYGQAFVGWIMAIRWTVRYWVQWFCSALQSHTTRQAGKSNAMLLDRTRGVFLAVLLVGVLPQPSAAAFIAFTDCLKPNIAESRDPVQLHWNSIRVSATFNTSAPSHNLNVTIYGNVTGQATVEKLPPPDDPQWTNPNGTLGKILDLSPSNNKYATLFTTFNVLNYAPYSPPPSRFCNSTLLTTCPIAPVFNFTDGYVKH